LVDRTLLRSAGQSIFLTEFATDRHWVLSEHRLLAEAIVPGTTYLEMACVAAAQHYGRPATELLDVQFLVPLLVPDGQPVPVHLTVRELSDTLAEFTVASHDADSDRWTMHAQGKVSVGAVAPPPRQEPDELLAGSALWSVDVGTRQDSHDVMQFGPRWRDSLRTVHVGVRRALGELHLSDEYRSEHEAYRLHPALLDLATGFSRFAVLDGAQDRERSAANQDFFLPVGYESLRIHRPLPARALSVIRDERRHPNTAEVRTVDVLVCDAAGEVAVEIGGFTVKLVRDPRRTVAGLRRHARHHAMQWRPAAAEATSRVAPPTDALVIGAPGSMAEALGEQLRSRGVRVTRAELADASAVGADGVHRFAPTADGLAWLLGACGEAMPDEIIHVAAPAGPADHRDLGSLSALLDHGVYTLFHLVHALSGRAAMPRRLSVVAPEVHRVSGTERHATPAHAALFGLAKVIESEHAALPVMCVDVGRATGAGEVCDELFGPRTPRCVALRDGSRYVAELAAARLQAQPSDPPGVYLVSGGSGGLGLALARHLTRTVAGVRVALVSRRGPGDRTARPPEWTANGAQVRQYRGDVTNPDDMAEVVRAVTAEFGPIDCVVHAAGVAGDGFLFRKDLDTFRHTLAPKVLGAAVLDEVTADSAPAMVLFGSTVSVFGAPGQGDYTAANAFLDAFAEHRTARGRRTTTIRWSDWLETGMAVDHGVEPDRGFFRSIGIEDALASFDEILASDAVDVIVGEVNVARLSTMAPDEWDDLRGRAPLTLSAPIEAAVAAAAAGRAPNDEDTAEPPDDGPWLLGRPDGAYTGTERSLAGLLAIELGLREVSVADEFLQIGLDSLVALRLAQRMQKVLGTRVAMADLFRHATIADLAKHLDVGESHG
jgi:NAD(P)-dependent dehydrogenase (short-subunit alcohol dehydrogenase family)/aryl carrier-like protein